MSSPDHEETPVPLPSAKAVQLGPNLTLQPPLSRRGQGPSLIIVTSGDLSFESPPDCLDPSPLQKWAEEGFVVLEVTLPTAADTTTFGADLKRGIEALLAHPTCDQTKKIGLIGE
jgi:carboxymethylenebutenolidase